MFLDTWQDQAIVTATCKIKTEQPFEYYSHASCWLCGACTSLLCSIAPALWDVMFIGHLRLEVLFLLLQPHTCP